ncbi:hypothetical protein FACS1894186_4330 [Alphaproteobacteria bacterium]|nr:hypothetical protein FACS1894186_4330 [Alphaproteobacteria bacterium]
MERTSNLYSRAEFFGVFCDYLAAGGEWTGIKSLPVQDAEMKGAEVTASKLYDMAQKYRFMRFLIEKDLSVWATWIIIAQFVGRKTDAVVEECCHFSIKEMAIKKVRKWLRIGKKQESENPSASGFLERLGLAKQPKPEKSSAEPAAS